MEDAQATYLRIADRAELVFRVRNALRVLHELGLGRRRCGRD
ncbi:MAG: hypothetical protein CM1200mP14_14350 [Gammaproteobacteria bacterium]|nr:MAG: hypothetical protein CM1200mP14_14350 [Gammaproteobacteria bacterium]